MHKKKRSFNIIKMTKIIRIWLTGGVWNIADLTACLSDFFATSKDTNESVFKD